MTIEAKVTWVRDRQFVGVASSGHALVVDASAQKEGASPMELILIGLVGCTAHDVLDVLQKKRLAVSDVEVHARAERAENPPRVYTHIHVEYLVRGRELPPKAVETAIRLSSEKYCSAAAMLGKTAEITTSYRIEKDEGS